MPTMSVANEAQWRLHVKCQFGIDVIAVIYTTAVTAELSASRFTAGAFGFF